jgi:uncharacterized OB-fold protein
MVKCPHCGKVLTKNENFCWHCEADLSEIKAKMEQPGSEEEH